MILNVLLNREIGCLSYPQLYNLRNNNHLIKRFSLGNKLEIHKGCVNTISWSEDGIHILSGSDDKFLKITNAFGNDCDAISIKSQHKSNIFSTTFLSQSNNKKFVSSSSNGGLFYTNIEQSIENPIVNEFKCHGYKTCFEVKTLPENPFVFLSCGKDGTVKFFDLRIKTKCETEFCNEDTLIKAPVGITSMDVCPSSPHIACGCMDGSVRIYDRRFLSTNRNTNTNSDDYDDEAAYTNHGIFSTFNYYDFINADETKKRITSIHYDKSGEELLVSYQPGNIVLLDWKYLTVNDNFFKNTSNANYLSSHSVKKFRVQTSWNDTGPDSRPNSSAILNDNSRQRFVSLIDSWIEERLNTTNNTNSNQNQEVASAEILGEKTENNEPALSSLPENLDEEENMLEKCDNTKLPSPQIKMVYSGHRNLRTIIKDCSFWGSKFICSGSDCGFIYFWEKESGRIINILQADKHVVNCVEENPIFPILASSGIDYNIKIWEPKLNEPVEKTHDIEEMISRNRAIIEEQRETLTIPLRFLLPALRLFRQNDT